MRALALLGMAYVRERAGLTDDLAAGYEELASDGAGQRTSAPARSADLRANMDRRAGTASAAHPQ